MKHIIKIFLFIFLSISSFTVAQDLDKYDAKTYFKYKDYNRALKKYLDLYQTDNSNTETNLNIGICYLNINDDRSKAIPYLESVYNKGVYQDDLLLYMGIAYTYAYKFDDAILFLNKYKKNSNPKNQDIAESYIKNCENAKILMQNPVNVSFENMGPKINTEFPEYFPFITKNQQTIYFTSTREKNVRKKKSSLGFYTSDIYSADTAKKEWKKAVSIGNTVNTIEDEQCVYVSPSGKNMIVSVDNEDSFGDLFISTTGKKGQFSKLMQFSKPVNSKKIELEGCISEDENTLFISSNRKGGQGAMDIYMLTKLPDGKWSTPLNLGPNINTEYKEAFPVFDEKKGILYFSSQGHINMGGFDIFKSKYDSVSRTFEPAINIGYPINTPEDNMQFSLAENYRDAYISAYRPGGLGDLDIYKLTFNDVAIELEKQKEQLKKHDTIIYIYIKDTVTSVQPVTNDLVYRVQIGVYQNPVPPGAFKGLNAIYAETFSGGTKYFFGAFSDLENALHAKDYVKNIGLTDAFVVAFNNKKRITLEEAKQIEKK